MKSAKSACGKARYRSYKVAQRVVHLRAKAVDLRIYWHAECGAWHVTHLL
jgi:hypothetical protein